MPKGYEQITDKKSLSDILYDLAKNVAEFQKPPLLLIDDYDVIPEETRYWLDSTLPILPVLDKRRRQGKLIPTTKEE